MNRTSTQILCMVNLMLVLAVAILGPGASDRCRGDTPVKKLDFSDGSVWIAPNASAKEVQAAKELQTYLYSISQKKLAIRPLARGQTDGGPAIIVGTVKSLSEITAGFPEQVARLKKGTNEAFDLYVGTHNGAPTALVLANEPIGAIYGIYTFLEKLGIGFYLGGDVFPGTNVRLQVAEMNELWSPALPIRGCVIWYNFLNGPATWNLEDYKYFFDQMVKMKANLVSFPEYGHGFTNYMSGGKLVPGVPLPTSEWKTSCTCTIWGAVRGMKTAEFGFGAGEFFTGPAFGSKATVDAKDDQDAIRRSQELFAQAVAYAQQRGIKVGLGFQLSGLPQDTTSRPTNVKDVEARLRVLVTKYPGVEYVWFWSGEGSAPPSVDFVEQACQAVKAIAPDKQVVLSGWGGDQRGGFTSQFPSLDKVLPKDVIFSSLDNIDPTWEPKVSQFYGKLPTDRQRWVIPWWESDGGGSRHDQFMPQCNTKPFSALLPDVLRKGCQGVLGIHWRTRAVEDVAAYMMNFTWNPTTTTYESFWSDFATRCFGAADAPEMTKILMELDALGPRWTGGGGQIEFDTFTWMAPRCHLWIAPPGPQAENLQTLKRIRQKLQSVADRDRQRGKAQFLDRVERLINEIDWVTLYDEAAMQILQAEAKSATDKAAAADLLRKAPLGKAMQAYTRLLYTQSDWGVLATVNVKAYAAFEKLYKQCANGAVPGSDASSNLPIQVAFKEPNKIVTEGEPLPVRIIATGGQSIGSTILYYRSLGEGEFVATTMTRGFGNVYHATIPGSAVTEKGLEYYIEVKSIDGQLFRVPKGLPSIAVTVAKLE